MVLTIFGTGGGKNDPFQAKNGMNLPFYDF